MSKKVIIILSIFIILTVSGIALYWWLAKPIDSSLVDQAPTPTETPAEPQIKEANPLDQTKPLAGKSTLVKPLKKLEALNDNPAFGFAIKSNLEVIYFDKTLGQFIITSLSGKNRLMASGSKFTNLDKVIWSPDKTEAILIFAGGLSYYYNLTENFSQKLPVGARDFSWSPSGDKIVYEIGDEPTSRKIMVASPDASGQIKIKDLGYASRVAGWSSLAGGPVSLVQVYSLGSGRDVYPVYENGASGQALKLSGYGDKVKYSRDGKRLLFPVVDTEEFKQTLWVADIDGLNNYSLGVQTFIEKCVWDRLATFVYCAVPSEALGAEPKLEQATTDNFWKINTKTGEKTKLYDQSEADIKIDAENVWTSPSEDRLYFENVRDGKIYILYLQ